MKKTISTLLLILALTGSAALAGPITKLTTPNTTGGMPIQRTIENRRSVMDFSTTELPDELISQLLWAAQGITDTTWNFRTAPSAGALYPLEIYVVKSDGLFHYLPAKHSIEKLSGQDLRTALTQASLGQNFINDAPVSFIIAAAYERTRSKYGARAERYVYAECGHAAENLHLQAVSLGLGSAPIGAFWDDVVSKVINLPDDQYPLYIIPVGYPK